MKIKIDGPSVPGYSALTTDSVHVWARRTRASAL